MEDSILQNLKKLCAVPAVSGNESAVRETIINLIKDHCEYRTDSLGNLLVYKRGNKRPAKKLLLAAHMDEVGFIVTSANPDGLLSFHTVGGIDPRVITGKRITIKTASGDIPGVIGIPPVHMIKKSEEGNALKLDSLFLDIGVNDQNDAASRVQPGDTAFFERDFLMLGGRRVSSPALDDRTGCAVLISLIRSALLYDTYFAFTVQEEVGTRGAYAAAYQLEPDYVIIADATTAADATPGITGSKKVCALDLGPVISFMDLGTVYDRDFFQLIQAHAVNKGIPFQVKSAVVGGNDGTAMHKTRKGAKTAAISLPARYIHAPHGVVSLNDLENTVKLLYSFCTNAEILYSAE